MITTKDNPFIAHKRNNKPFTFLGCSTHRGEVEQPRMLQAEIYTFPKNEIKISEYRFVKNDKTQRELFLCIKNCLEENSRDSHRGLIWVHPYDSSNVSSFSQELKESILNLCSEILKNPNYHLPKMMTPNCDYNEVKKLSNSKNIKDFNEVVFSKRKHH